MQVPAPSPSLPTMAEASALVERLREKATASGLKLWSLAGKSLLPVVQGGMGVGVSAGGLAGTVARHGAIGTISSVDLRRLHPDLMEQTQHLEKSRDVDHARAVINDANSEALRREIARARELSMGFGLVAVNVMKAISAYASNVRTALEAGIDAVVVGAGLPLDLPELAKEHPKA